MRSDLRGNSDNPIDEKGRVSLPTKYRRLLSGLDLVLVRSNDESYPSLNLFTEEDYAEWVDDWFASEGGFKRSDTEHQRRQLGMMNAMEPVKLDNSYRIRIESELMRYAGITKKVRFVGMGDHVAIMSPETAQRLDEYLREAERQRQG